MQTRLSLTVLLIAMVAVISFNCQKEISGTAGNGPGTGTAASPAPVTATVQGVISDENGLPAAGVSVTVGTKGAVTDAKGFFRIQKAALDK